MGKRIFAGAFILMVVMFASYDLGSINGGSTESKNAVFYSNYKPSGFDTLVLSYDEHIRILLTAFKVRALLLPLFIKAKSFF